MWFYKFFQANFSKTYNYEFYTQNLSNCCRRKYDQSISRIFKILFLAGFCNLNQLCERACAWAGKGTLESFKCFFTCSYIAAAIVARWIITNPRTFSHLLNFQHLLLTIALIQRASHIKLLHDEWYINYL